MGEMRLVEAKRLRAHLRHPAFAVKIRAVMNHVSLNGEISSDTPKDAGDAAGADFADCSERINGAYYGLHGSSGQHCVSEDRQETPGKCLLFDIRAKGPSCPAKMSGVAHLGGARVLKLWYLEAAAYCVPHALARLPDGPTF